MVEYIPKLGDLVVLTFDPQSGHEQKGRRPAIIVSNEVFNRGVGLAFACPITNTKRGFPFHIEVNSPNLTGYIMVEQCKSIDFRARKIKFIEKADRDTIDELLAILSTIVDNV